MLVHRDPTRRIIRLGPQFDVRHVFLSPDQRYVVTQSHWSDGSGIRAKLWECNTGRLVSNIPGVDGDCVRGFSPDGRWLLVVGKQYKQVEVASLVAAPFLAETGPKNIPSSWRRRSRSECLDIVSDPHENLTALDRSDGAIELHRPATEEMVATLLAPEADRLHCYGFTPDGTQLLAFGEATRAFYVYDLRRIREQLAELGLDWDLPSYAPAKPEEHNPILGPRLRVEFIDAEWGISGAKLAEHERRLANEALKKNPEDAYAHFRLGARLLEAGKPAEAYQHLSRALDIRPDMYEALPPLARCAQHMKRWDEAERWASACLKTCPFESSAREVRARARMEQRRPAEAVEDLSRLIATYPRSDSYYEMRCRCYEVLGQHELARADRAEADRVAGRRGTTLP